MLAAANALFIYVGVTDPGLTYAAETKHVLIGLAVLLISVLLWIFRKVVQDGESPQLREETPATPEAARA